MPPERVPDPLRQKFLPYDGGYQLEYSKYLDIRKGSDCNVKFFRNCSGEFVNFIALNCANCVVLCRPSGDRSETRYVFPEELTVKDIEYIRCEDGGYGFVVALNSTRISVHPHCVALLRWNGAQLQLVRKLKMDQEITCLKVVADGESMIHLSPLLHPKMISWPHIVAVGTRYAHCYLFHFDQLQQQQRDDVHVPLSGTLTDGLS
uniref:CNH domain-containing protein n=1 Tax=Angiostrongylus cantonensis TaxID=6313 RepID=A0A0K0D339_ANGCA